MLIVGDVSGIQDFVFAVPEEEGGQARMLRARSFFVQVLTEVLAFRVQRALGLGRDSLLFCAAGKFAIEADGDPEELDRRVAEERVAVEEWLARETAGALRFAVAVGADALSDAAWRYEAAIAALERAKLRSWFALANGAGGWRPKRLVFNQPDPKRQAETFRGIGRALPSATTILIATSDGKETPVPERGAFALPGFHATLHTEENVDSADAVVLRGDLRGTGRSTSPGGPPEVRRPLARHIPTHPDGSPIWFEDLARRARGAPYLGVLKMDADSLGLAVRDRLCTAENLTPLAQFSAELDDFFAVEVDQLLRRREWQETYTIFSGGDDLLLVGPWDRMFDLAGEIRQRFHRRFGSGGLTISGGLALVRYRFPIRRAVAQAETLLDRAKGEPSPGASAPKDQMAALGQVWKWDHHATIVAAGKRLAEWVEQHAAQRGWLHTMLALSRLRRSAQPGVTASAAATATARLAYHVSRNYPGRQDPDPRRRALREWADHIVRGFDRFNDATVPQIVYLPAIERYALLATRSYPEE
jgi:CRISPR-associated protein Csm1